jgi:hypothetical protein
MKESIAEELLGKVMDWDTPKAKEEIPKLKYLAETKYDSYRNFEPGRRFLESLVLWLHQFRTLEERQTVYEFIDKNLLYISEKQMSHLVELLYPQRVLSILIEQTSRKEKLFPFHIKQIRSSQIFKLLKRKSLFLGMSDGARIDTFRRKNALNNEQVSVSYELSKEKYEGIHNKLKNWLLKKDIQAEAKFENIFLIDDFSGSGNSILRLENGEYDGKLFKFIKNSIGSKDEPEKLGKYCIDGGPRLFVVTYISTKKAMNHLKETIKNYIETNRDLNLLSCEILEPLLLLDSSISVTKENPGNEFAQLLDNYYDKRLDDEYTETGGTDVKYGYAGCALPLVLSHNCPNNSIYLLWGQTDKTEEQHGLRALFPRISRHLEER